MSLIHQVLTQYWGYSNFRPMQEEIIQSIMDGNDTLALLPTGGGKSLCFQVPAMAKEGICLVISPLIALMKDQEEQLKEKQIRAVAIISGMKKSEVDIALDNCINGNYKFLYVSPERLETELFKARFEQMNVNLIAVDEAHCISQWGYDFRPPYLQIAKIRALFPKVPVMALTASATPEVRKDICDKLELKNPKVFVKSFARSNLSYIVRHEDNKNEHLLRVLKNVPGTSIVYVRNRRKTQETANFLLKSGIKADFYHAGLDHQSRTEKQKRWMNGTTRVIVSTNAFGMGINKPDVRSVVHIDLPDDPESYYQEAGRGGRDEKPAYAVVLYNQSDILQLEQRMQQNFPEIEEIKKIYQALCNYLQIPINSGEGLTWGFDLISFCQHYDFDPVKAYNSFKVLELENIITLSESVYLPSRIHLNLKSMELYKFQVENVKYDHLIKTMLRSYSGLFDEYVRFSESELAKRAAIELSALKTDLTKLHEMEVINYLPATEQPRLTFNQGRIDTRYLKISAENLEDRKQRFVIRANAFKHYITDKHHCRSMILLGYFGEGNLQRCGTCDYCRERNKLELNDLEVEELTRELKNILNEGPVAATEITDKIQGFTKDKITAVIRWLIDNDVLGSDALGRIFLKRD
ncbi:RecQ family ATP-dependent DNA helicase [soil metagenome]